MYEGFEYVSKHGILLKEDYPYFHRYSNRRCEKDQKYIDEKAVLRNIGYVENDNWTNEQMKKLVAK